MAKAKQSATAALVGVLGAVKAKRFPASTPTLTIGSASDCAVQVRGEMVSARHATIRRSATDSWTIANQSPYGTVVNERLVEESQLAHGDLIQIGQSVMFRFETSASEPASIGRSSAISRLKQRPIIALALVVYLLAIAAVGIVLASRSGPGDVGPALTLQQIELSRVATVRQLGETDAARESARQAYEVMVAAWAYEQQDRWVDAMAAYRKVGDLLPDPQISLTQLANQRAAAVRNKLPKKK